MDSYLNKLLSEATRAMNKAKTNGEEETAAFWRGKIVVIDQIKQFIQFGPTS